MRNAVLKEFSVRPEGDSNFSLVTIGVRGTDGSVDLSWTARVLHDDAQAMTHAAIYEAIIWLGNMRNDEQFAKAIALTANPYTADD